MVSISQHSQNTWAFRPPCAGKILRTREQAWWCLNEEGTLELSQNSRNAWRVSNAILLAPHTFSSLCSNSINTLVLKLFQCQLSAIHFLVAFSDTKAPLLDAWLEIYTEVIYFSLLGNVSNRAQYGSQILLQLQKKWNILRALEQWTLIWNSWSCGQLSLTAAHVAFLNNFHRCIWNQKRFSMFSAPWSPGHFHLVHYKKVKVRGLGSSIKKCNFQPVEVVPWTCRDNYRNSWRDWEMDFPVSAH